MLSEILERDSILLDLEVEDFKDAIRKSTKPLIKNNSVKQSYVDKIIEIYDETGPYIVITKNIALPHAPSDSGVNKTNIGFSRLKTPVISHHKTNDPVKFLFPLSAQDGNAHLELLSELVTLLSDESFIEFIEEVESPEALLKFIEEYEGGNENV
ncbi:PTS sugar transporter subunit IIA [Macrococcus sp. EM39E]|uniref:PTS sugar transporter subunit IIA n=1 Tax=Macrococcus animalis TaxID=3395467 RepID=UPI0039BE29E7